MFLLFFIQPDLRVTDGTAAATELAGTPQRMGKCREISPETVHGASSLMASFHNLGNYIYYSFFKIHMYGTCYFQELAYVHLMYMLVHANLDLRNYTFPCLNRVMFDLRKIYIMTLRSCRPKNFLMEVICNLKSFLNREHLICIFRQ